MRRCSACPSVLGAEEIVGEEHLLPLLQPEAGEGPLLEIHMALHPVIDDAVSESVALHSQGSPYPLTVEAGQGLQVGDQPQGDGFTLQDETGGAEDVVRRHHTRPGIQMGSEAIASLPGWIEKSQVGQAFTQQTAAAGLKTMLHQEAAAVHGFRRGPDLEETQVVAAQTPGHHVQEGMALHHLSGCTVLFQGDVEG